jgi:S-adenosylmethionine hydrolase
MPAVIPIAREEAGVMLGEVLWVDRFGNCQLNVSPAEVEHWGDRIRVSVGDRNSPTVRAAKVVANFTEIGTGAIGLVVDSYGMLALALDRRSAADELSIGAGDQVVLIPITDDDPDAGRGSTGPVVSPVTLRTSR